MKTEHLYFAQDSDFKGLQRSTLNPFNIRYNPSNDWKGQLTKQNGFCTFNTIGAGIRAGYCLLANYLKRGDNTVSKILNKFAPSTENDTKKYIKYVVDKINQSYPAFKGKDITSDSPLTIAYMSYLSAAIIAYESGIDFGYALNIMRSFEILNLEAQLHYLS